MKTFLTSLSAVVIAALFCAVVGCNKEKPAADMMGSAPAWVTKGSGAFTGDRGKAFYGVGSAPKMIDVSMQRDRASDRARRGILQVLTPTSRT